jgi:hypothetical protein
VWAERADVALFVAAWLGRPSMPTARTVLLMAATASDLFLNGVTKHSLHVKKAPE